jgi:hypothetical protein
MYDGSFVIYVSFEGGGKRVEKVARLRTGRSGVGIPAEASHFSLLQRVQTGSEAHPIQ